MKKKKINVFLTNKQNKVINMYPNRAPQKTKKTKTIETKSIGEASEISS